MDWIARECEKSGSIFIYGAGTISNILFLYLIEQELAQKVSSFIITKKEGNPNDKFGIPVCEVEEVGDEYRKNLVLIATQKITHGEICKGLALLGFTNYICINEDDLIKRLYSLFYREPIQNNKVVFMNMAGLGYGCNPKYIAQKLIEMDPKGKLDLVWAVSDERHIFPKCIRTVKIGTYQYYKELSTAHVWIDNARKQYDTRKREGQYYIQTWHGAAPIKKVEKDVEYALPETYIVNAIRDSEMADLFLAGSMFYTELIRKSFWYAGEIMEVGLPRHDIFWNEIGIKEKVYDYYDIPRNKGMMLYAPTFRKDFSNESYDLDICGCLKALKARFGKEFVCAVSKHPSNRYIEYGFCKEEYIEVDKYEDFQELLVAADILVTDYSGCMYDFSFTKRPVFLYQRDLEDYELDRNFYIEMGNLPYIKAESNEELFHKIINFDEVQYVDRIENFMMQMGNFDNGNAAEKVAKHILEIIGNV